MACGIRMTVEVGRSGTTRDFFNTAKHRKLDLLGNVDGLSTALSRYVHTCSTLKSISTVGRGSMYTLLASIRFAFVHSGLNCSQPSDAQKSDFSLHIPRSSLISVTCWIRSFS
jgi:hypothetical protein